MASRSLREYLEEKLSRNASHVLLLYEEISPFTIPKIIKTIDELETISHKKFKWLKIERLYLFL